MPPKGWTAKTSAQAHGAAQPEMVEVRLPWAQTAAMTDQQIREHLRTHGLDTRALNCRRDDAGRAWIYVGPRVTA